MYAREMLAMKTELPEDRIQVMVLLRSPCPASPAHAHPNLEERRHMRQSLLLWLNPHRLSIPCFKHVGSQTSYSLPICTQGLSVNMCGM